MRPRIVGVTVVVLLSLATSAFAEPRRCKSFLVQGAWLRGIGCPTNAMLAVPNATFTGVAGHTPFTDPACPTGQTSNGSQGWLRMRWGGAVPLLAFQVPGFNLVDISGKVISLAIVFDEGQDTGPDNFGMAVLDNIDVNGVLVGKGATDAD
jgi:hypothetical protein